MHSLDSTPQTNLQARPVPLNSTLEQSKRRNVLVARPLDRTSHSLLLSHLSMLKPLESSDVLLDRRSQLSDGSQPQERNLPLRLQRGFRWLWSQLQYRGRYRCIPCIDIRGLW